MYGLKTNLEKSDLILVGKVDGIERLISQLGCRPGDLPSNDFRSPLGASFKQASSLLLHKQHQLLRGLSLLN